MSFGRNVDTYETSVCPLPGREGSWGIMSFMLLYRFWLVQFEMCQLPPGLPLYLIVMCDEKFKYSIKDVVTSVLLRFLWLLSSNMQTFPCQVSFTFQDPWRRSESVNLLILWCVVAESQRRRHGPDPIIAPLLSTHYLSPTCSSSLFSPFPPLAFLWMLSTAAYALIPQLLYSKNNN